MIQLVLYLSLQVSRLLRSGMLPANSSTLRLAFLTEYFALKILLLVH